MRKEATLVVLFTLCTSCIGVQQEDYLSGDSSSNLSSVNLDYTNLNLNDPNNLLNAGYVEISPVDSDCKNATKVAKLFKYEESQLDISLVNTCSYTLKVMLGKTLDGEQLSEVYFSNEEIPHHIDAQKLQEANTTDTRKYKADVLIRITNKGREAGFDKTEVTPQLSEQSNLSETFAKITFSESEDSSKKSLADHFKGKYLYLDVSASWCGPCRQFAATAYRNSQLQAVVNSKKCSFAILVVRDNRGSSLQGWKSVSSNLTQEAKLFAQSNTFEISNYANTLKNIGVSVKAFPTKVLLDREGKPSSAPSLDSFVNMCNTQ